MLRGLYKFLFERRQMTYELIVMRLGDMFIQHPHQDNSRVCDLCGATVGIYPDGQDFIKKHGKEHVKLHCQRCVGWPGYPHEEST